MAMPSIARRIGRSHFLLSVSMVSVMVALVIYVNEQQEAVLRDLSFVQERDFFLAQLEEDSLEEPLLRESDNVIAYFIPDAWEGNSHLPEIFSGLPAAFNGEISDQDRWYQVNISQNQQGRLYFAWDITRHEVQEQQFMWILTAASLAVLGLSLLLSVLLSRRLTVPLRRLSDDIRAIPVGESMPRLAGDHEDAELKNIADTFNHFLDELESFVRREKTLVSLASHELRTPIAVISGALDVLESRGQLTQGDAATLQRLRGAATEMEENTRILLRLARRISVEDEHQEVMLGRLVRETVDSLSAQFDISERLSVEVTGNTTVRTHVILARMLLRNLIKNALEHTDRTVRVLIRDSEVEIVDEGDGLSAAQQAILSDQASTGMGGVETEGLGLYIATLVCEQLGCRLTPHRTAPNGTSIRLQF